MADRILVVDDEEPIRNLLKTMLEREGYEIITAATGEEALEIAKDETFQLYILDMKLPGMDGIDLFKQIKPDRPTAFFFAITGYASIFDLVKCRDAGYDDFFPKPFKLEAILGAVNNAFEKIRRWKKG